MFKFGLTKLSVVLDLKFLVKTKKGNFVKTLQIAVISGT
jgi:hypothetical protein